MVTGLSSAESASFPVDSVTVITISDLYFQVQFRFIWIDNIAKPNTQVLPVKVTGGSTTLINKQLIVVNMVNVGI